MSDRAMRILNYLCDIPVPHSACERIKIKSRPAVFAVNDLIISLFLPCHQQCTSGIVTFDNGLTCMWV